MMKNIFRNDTIDKIPRNSDDLFRIFQARSLSYRIGAWISLGFAILSLLGAALLLGFTAYYSFVLDASVLRETDQATVESLQTQAQERAKNLVPFLSVSRTLRPIPIDDSFASVGSMITEVFTAGSGSTIALGRKNYASKVLDDPLDDTTSSNQTPFLARWDKKKLAWDVAENNMPSGSPSPLFVTEQGRLVFLVYSDNGNFLFRTDHSGLVAEDLSSHFEDIDTDEFYYNKEINTVGTLAIKESKTDDDDNIHHSNIEIKTLNLNNLKLKSRNYQIDLEKDSKENWNVTENGWDEYRNRIAMYILNNDTVAIVGNSGNILTASSDGYNIIEANDENLFLGVYFDFLVFLEEREGRHHIALKDKNGDLRDSVRLNDSNNFIWGKSNRYTRFSHWSISGTTDYYSYGDTSFFQAFIKEKNNSDYRDAGVRTLLLFETDNGMRAFVVRGLITGVGNLADELIFSGYDGSESGGLNSRNSFLGGFDKKNLKVKEQFNLDSSAIYDLLSFNNNQILAVGSEYNLLGLSPLFLVKNEGTWTRVHYKSDTVSLLGLHQLGNERIVSFGRVLHEGAGFSWTIEPFAFENEINSMNRLLLELTDEEGSPIVDSPLLGQEIDEIRTLARDENIAKSRLARIESLEEQSSGRLNDWSVLAITSLMRLTLIAILFFVSQVLINLYRFMMRIGVFFQACGKAVAMTADPETGRICSIQDLKTVIETLTPDQLRFDEIPKPILNSVIQRFGVGGVGLAR